MARLRWAVLCQRVLTDRDTNSVSYIESVEEFGVPAIPFPFLPVVVGTLWERGTLGETIQMRIRLIGPDDKATSYLEATLEDATAMRHRANIQVEGPVIQAEGRHAFAIEQQVEGVWREECRIPVDVRLVAAQPAPAESA